MPAGERLVLRQQLCRSEQAAPVVAFLKAAAASSMRDMQQFVNELGKGPSAPPSRKRGIPGWASRVDPGGIR
ncbi:MAG: hypothetical protein M5R42_05525 [Rhodocyclaceae bacterium]|nr:hypothetical protein [Rhodocyclaceae bacterium]